MRSSGPSPRLAGLATMTPRDPREGHRSASPLELFFDLVFVVAVSFSSQSLHHLSAEGHLLSGSVAYLMVFFAIWWAWMNFTWFATSFATEDWLYRVMTFVQMAGVLILAAGADAAMVELDYTVVTIGYVIMRLALVGQWLRASTGRHKLRATAQRFAIAITVVQAAWVLRLFLPATAGLVVFFVLVAAELSVPVWAERRAATPWNVGHIAERYGLFTLILLGESILASASAVVAALQRGQDLPSLGAVSAAGLVIAAGMWWVYFAREHDFDTRLGASLTFGYFHYVIFAAAGAFSAGVEVAVDALIDETELAPAAAAATLAVPVFVFLASVWWLTLRGRLNTRGTALFAAGLVLIAASIVLPGLAIAWVAVGVAVAVVATELGDAHRESAPTASIQRHHGAAVTND